MSARPVKRSPSVAGWSISAASGKIAFLADFATAAAMVQAVASQADDFGEEAWQERARRDGQESDGSRHSALPVSADERAPGGVRNSGSPTLSLIKHASGGLPDHAIKSTG